MMFSADAIVPLVIGWDDDGWLFDWQAGNGGGGRAMAEEIEPLAIGYPDGGFQWKGAEFTGRVADGERDVEGAGLERIQKICSGW